ncbi:OmpH family outer membrane protein [Flavobacterium silvaticum]|uniref:OmpH family outer membrane protein n=1 Tax=Flavobacterium silvaticum TaxID=1852020 RepID=A0A972JGP8_9FLAO|nr:OmpH family outer membrane protein [Flavobacterium silvaticum]NMH28421.1 OmpH family outer membrane protein [Flavobacterium silvaticum]
MKKIVTVLAFALTLIACDKPTEQKEFKTAYVDTAKMMEDYTEAKDVEAKYKAKSEEMGKELEADAARFKADAAAFEQKARALGEIWAQQNSAPLARRQQELQYKQQALTRQIQDESSTEMDTLVKKLKKFIKDYGKEKGYDYIFATGDVVSILSAKDQYDITKDVVKALNDKYASEGKKEAAAPAAAPATKPEETK